MALESFTDGSQQVTDAHTEKAMDAVIMDPLGKGILRMIDLVPLFFPCSLRFSDI